MEALFHLCLLSCENIKWLCSCFINVAFVTLFSALVRVLKSLPVKVIPREWYSLWLCPQWEWLHYFSFSLTAKQTCIIDNGGDFLHQVEVCHILGYPELLFFCDLSHGILCVKCRGGQFESTLVIRFPTYLSLNTLAFS